jgi:hypothetical protein
MTREEQIAAARRIAEDNPEWILRPWGDHAVHLRHCTGKAQVQPRGFGSWAAYRTGALFLTRLRTASGKARTFRSPAAAIRALGFTIKEREE